MSNNQPYNFSNKNPAGSLAQGVAGFIAGGLKQKSNVQEKLMEHNMRIRENVVGTIVKSKAKQEEIKTQGKQTRKNIKTEGKTTAKTQESQLKSVAKTAKKMSKKVAQPGTEVQFSPTGAAFTAKQSKTKSTLENVGKAVDLATNIASGPAGKAIKTATKMAGKKVAARRLAARAAARRGR